MNLDHDWPADDLVSFYRTADLPENKKRYQTKINDCKQ